MIIWDIFHRNISLNSVLMVLLVTFRLELMYISHHKYKVKSLSCLWFSAAYAAAVDCRNQFFCLLSTE